VASKLTSRFVRRVLGLLFFLVAAASVLLAVQLQNGYAQDARVQVTLDTKTPASTGPIENNGGEVTVDVKAYGALGDGVTNDTAAFKAALASLTAAGGGVCLVPKGTYIISASGITAPFIPAVSSGVHLVGVGRGASILKVNGMPTSHLLQCDGDNWSVEDLTFDMQDYFPRPLLSAITCKGANWRVANCAVIKIGRFGISAFGGDNWSIEGNYISKTAPVGIENQSINVSVSKTGTIYATNARITDNVCEGSGIWFWGNHSTIARNRISRTGFGTGIGTGQSVHADALHISGNICTGGRGFDQNRTWVSGFELWAPNSVIANNTAYDNDGSGIVVGGQNCIVIGNHSYDNGVGARGFGFGARYANSVDNASGSIFIANSARDPRSPRRSPTQSYGYVEQPGGLHEIMHLENDYNGNKIGPTRYSSTGGQPMRISPAMKNKLEAIADAKDINMPASARRTLREFLDRE
jgi:hypothetical protein